MVAIDCRRSELTFSFYTEFNNLLAICFGGSRGNCLNGYLLCKQSNNQTKSLYRLMTFAFRLTLAIS